MKPESTPGPVRAKIVYLVWNNLPRVFLLCLIVLAVTGIFMIREKSARLAAEKAGETREERQLTNVVVLETAPILMRDTINLPGTMEPWEKLAVSAKVGGTVVEVPVREGDPVVKGAVLARLEEDDYRIALESAKAAWSLAKAEMARIKAMHSRGIAPQAELERITSSYLKAKADLDYGELRLSRCVITSPMDGIVSRMDVRAGSFLSVADPVAEILQMDKLKAVVGIPESDVAAVRNLEGIRLAIQALNNMEVSGKKYFLSPRPESYAHVYRLELAVDNHDNAILPGMFARARIVKEEKPAALAVPLYSIISRNDEQFVYLERDGSVSKSKVETGIMDGWMVEITSGLAVGDRVVIEGHRDIEGGQEVRVIRAVSSMDSI